MKHTLYCKIINKQKILKNLMLRAHYEIVYIKGIA